MYVRLTSVLRTLSIQDRCIYSLFEFLTLIRVSYGVTVIINPASQLLTSIQDTGCGMLYDNQAKAFQRHWMEALQYNRQK